MASTAAPCPGAAVVFSDIAGRWSAMSRAVTTVSRLFDFDASGRGSMDLSIAAILAQDGITTGAIYALLALALVLVFSVTRVIFIPQGEFVSYGALTLAALQTQKFPATCWLLMAMGAACFVV
jgi:uncharacterized membrane protein (UPF0136 family)